MFYHSFSYDELRSIVQRYTTVIEKESDTGKLVFSQFGGRLLGLFPDGRGDNVLWVNEELDPFLVEHQPHIGGERLWISPERNFYYENPRDFEGYHVPSEIDPGEYVCKNNSDNVVFESTFSLLEYDQNKLFDNSNKKRSFSVIHDPYRTGLPFAGVSITDEITVPDTEIQMCAWSIAQVYTCGPESPGTVLIPANKKALLISYFNQLPDDRMESLDHYVRFKIDGCFSGKLGIRPEDLDLDNPCKAVYLSPSAKNKSTWFCVIKQSLDIPKTQDECLDMVKSNPQGPKGAVQAFNTDHGSAEPVAYPCGELGLQLAKGKVLHKKTISKATHELLSYSGTREKLLDLVSHILRIKEPPVLY
jgi:hypothetical protein